MIVGTGFFRKVSKPATHGDRWVSCSCGLSLDRDHNAAIKDLERAPSAPEMTITQVNNRHLEVHLTTAQYAYFVHLIVPDEHSHFSDNYFDMEAGEERTITITNPANSITAEMVTLGYR